MRMFLEILVVLGLAVVVGVFFFQQRTGQQGMDREAQVRDELRLLYERTSYHAALDLSETLDKGEYPMTEFPVQIDPEWFGGRQPGNVLAPRDHPWIDVAPPGDLAIHPPDPVLLRQEQAGVWYNPNNGVFRARTPIDAGDELTLARYNRINGTSLGALPRDGDTARRPLAYEPGLAPGAMLASQDRAANVTEVSRTGDPDGALFAPVEFATLDPAGAPADNPGEEATEPRRPTLRGD